MYNGRSRRPESDLYGTPPKRGRASGFDTGRSLYSAQPLPLHADPSYASHYDLRAYDPLAYEPLGAVGMHARGGADLGLIGGAVYDRPLDSGAYLMDARGGAGVMQPGVRGVSAGVAGPPFPSAAGGRPQAGGLPLLPVVRCRGLPFECTEDDVMGFFAGLEVLDVVLPRKDGRATGDAWVLLSSPTQRELAVQRNRMRMGRRYVEVFQSQRQDYYKAIVQESQAPSEGEPAAGTTRPTRLPPPAAGAK